MKVVLTGLLWVYAAAVTAFLVWGESLFVRDGSLTVAIGMAAIIFALWCFFVVIWPVVLCPFLLPRWLWKVESDDRSVTVTSSVFPFGLAGGLGGSGVYGSLVLVDHDLGLNRGSLAFLFIGVSGMLLLVGTVFVVVRSRPWSQTVVATADSVEWRLSSPGNLTSSLTFDSIRLVRRPWGGKVVTDNPVAVVRYRDVFGRARSERRESNPLAPSFAGRLGPVGFDRFEQIVASQSGGQSVNGDGGNRPRGKAR